MTNKQFTCLACCCVAGLLLAQLLAVVRPAATEIEHFPLKDAATIRCKPGLPCMACWRCPQGECCEDIVAPSGESLILLPTGRFTWVAVEGR